MNIVMNEAWRIQIRPEEGGMAHYVVQWNPLGVIWADVDSFFDAEEACAAMNYYFIHGLEEKITEAQLMREKEQLGKMRAVLAKAAAKSAQATQGGL